MGVQVSQLIFLYSIDSTGAEPYNGDVYVQGIAIIALPYHRNL